MLNGIKLVGVCLTKMEDEGRRDLLAALHRRALENGARLLVFNSPLDFYYHDEYDQGAKSIYQIVDMAQLDALVILDQSFYDKAIVRDLIDRARTHGVPTVVLYGHYDGCFCIGKDYRAAFGSLIRHVLALHQPRTVRYLAGTRGMAHTETRLSIFRAEMARCGRTVQEDDIFYCDDWSGPVIAAIDGMAASHTIPDALICASDVMAGAACSALERHGLRVPQDVIVTGFDGLKSLALQRPQLTTCAQDTAGTAALVFRMLNDALARNAAPYSADEQYQFVLSESCGCGRAGDVGFREIARQLFAQLDDTFHHEHNIFTAADRMMASLDLSTVNRALKQNLLPDSLLALNMGVLEGMDKVCRFDADQPFSDRMLVVMANQRTPRFVSPHRIDLHQMCPAIAGVIDEPVMFVFQAIHVGAAVCGYLVVKVNDIHTQAHKIRRLCRITNLSFSVIVNRSRHHDIADRMSRIKSLDPATGMMNLKGLTAYFEEHYPRLSGQCLAVSVYAIRHYQQLLEDQGVDYAERLIAGVSELLRQCSAPGALLARTSPDEFVVANLEATPEAVGESITRAVDAFYLEVEKHNALRGDAPVMEVQSGCVVSRPGWENNLASFIKAAKGEMYLNRMKSLTAPAAQAAAATPVDAQLLFQLLLEKNLFHYHFQPIVDARTGEIRAYEALMRTLGPVSMTPRQVLDIARKQDRLYDIERATLFNVMAYVDEHPEQFNGKRVFVNTIPGFFLHRADREELTRRFGHLFSQVTVEITETDDTDDAELMEIRRLESDSGACQLAIDDYGTGFSNIVNLLRYQPQVIKIDRFLVSGVERDHNKQLFLRSTIEFARMNNILVLAEGVETQSELSKVIELGVDLVQGFYLARPAENVLPELPEELRSFIIEETLRLSRFGVKPRIYHARSGETLSLLELAVQKYTGVHLAAGDYSVIGQKRHFIGLPFTTDPGSHVQLTMQDAYIGSAEPAIALGDGATAIVTFTGENVFAQQGIRVPETARITLRGNGSLTVTDIRQDGCAIGGSPLQSYGDLRVDMTGSLTIHAESEISVGLGGGYKADGLPIDLISGRIAVETRGIRAVAIGALDGTVNVAVGARASLDLISVGNEATAIGALSGAAAIHSEGSLRVTMEGEHIVGLGVQHGGCGQVKLVSGTADFSMLGANAVCAGSFGGAFDVDVSGAQVHLHVEGAQACGLGSYHGSGVTTISGGAVWGEILSGHPQLLGTATTITGGHVAIASDTPRTCIQASGPAGETLTPLSLPGERAFAAHIVTDESSYTYLAALPEGAETLCVYVPIAFAAAYPSDK